LKRLPILTFLEVLPLQACHGLTFTQKRFIELALENDCTVKDDKGVVRHSYAKLISVLKDKENKTEYNICWYIDLWLNNIFSPLYSIDETEIASSLSMNNTCTTLRVHKSFFRNTPRI
jgi:hypothetical protein